VHLIDLDAWSGGSGRNPGEPLAHFIQLGQPVVICAPGSQTRIATGRRGIESEQRSPCRSQANRPLLRNHSAFSKFPTDRRNDRNGKFCRSTDLSHCHRLHPCYGSDHIVDTGLSFEEGDGA
jgi:hypothetical protein